MNAETMRWHLAGELPPLREESFEDDGVIYRSMVSDWMLVRDDTCADTSGDPYSAPMRVAHYVESSTVFQWEDMGGPCGNVTHWMPLPGGPERAGRRVGYNYYRYTMWYTVWETKTGDLIASGPADLCARRLGYANKQSFLSAVSHREHDSNRRSRYIIKKELISRSEVDSLPPIKTRKKARRCSNTGEPAKG